MMPTEPKHAAPVDPPPAVPVSLGERVVVGGVAFDALTQAQAVEHVISQASAGRGGWVITANLDHARRARVDAEYQRMLDEADLVVADGTPLIWASRVQGTPLPERVAGSSMVEPLAKRAGEAGLSIYLLGATPGTAQAAGELLVSRYPGLKIAGVNCPPMGFDQDAQAMADLRQELEQARPDLVYVALGSPKQERLIGQLRADLPSTWWLGIGISLSFLTGEVQRAPLWLQRLGLEWLHRLVQEPRRLARRYLVHGLPFACRLAAGSVWERATGRGR